MGADISFPLSKVPDQTTIDEKTQSTIIMMNKILDFILRNADISDMISLATDKGCKEWLVISESRITKLFDKIQIEPTAGKDGVLYLKKIKDLDKKSREAVVIDENGKNPKKLLHQDYCNVLSFFFIRLFQVVGALALSIIDTEIPRVDYGSTERAAEPRRGIPFFQTIEEKPKSWFSSFFGGAIGKPVLDYMIDNGTIKAPFDFSIGSGYAGIKYKQGHEIPNLTISKRNNIYTLTQDDVSMDLTFTPDNVLIINNIHAEGRVLPFHKKEPYRVEGKSLQVKNTFVIEYFFQIINQIIDVSNYNNIIIVLKSKAYLDSSNKIRGTNILWDEDNSNPSFSLTKELDVEGKNTTIKISFKIYLTIDSNAPTKYGIQIKDITIKPDNLLINMGTKDEDEDTDTDEDTDAVSGIVNFHLDANYVPRNRYKKTIPEYVGRRMNILLQRAERSLKEGLLKTKEGYVRPISNIKSTNPLKYTDLWNTLIQKPPIKSFCTARALQLLNASGLAQTVPKEIQTLVYETKFPLYANKSLPIPGQSITTAAPFKALEALYKPNDTILNKLKSDKPSIMPYKATDSEEIRTKSLGQLIVAFTQNDKSTIRTIEELKEAKISDTSSKEVKDAATIKALRAQAIKLFEKQFSHTQKVNAILRKLFIINTTITLHPAIMARGVSGIEEIAIEARNLLTDYYSTCQTDYNEGIKILQTHQNPNQSHNSKNTQKLNSAPAPAKYNLNI